MTVILYSLGNFTEIGELVFYVNQVTSIYLLDNHAAICGNMF